MKRHSLLVLIVSTAIGFPAFAADDVPTLRYGWQAGQAYAYRVEIQAAKKDETEILSGMPHFVVKSVSKDNAVLQVSGEQLASRREAKVGGFPGRPRVPAIGRPGFGTTSGHELTLDLRGRVVKESGQASLPYLLGDLPDLILPKFSDKADKTWKSSRELVIRVTQQGRIPSPFREAAELKRMNAEETIEYTVKESDEKTATLTRKYSLKTVETVDGEPVIDVSGEGTIVFDRVRGVPASLEYSGKVVEREANGESRVPLKVSISLLSAEEQQKIKAEREAADAAAKAPLTPPERAEILENLRSPELVKWLRAVQTLKAKPPAEPDPEMAAVLAEQFNGDNTRRVNMAQALETWATEKEIPALVKMLDDNSQVIANSAIGALARLKAPEAIDPLVKQLEKQSARHVASRALRAIGPAAEAAVQKAVESNDRNVRLEAVTILAEIGTAKSLDSLKSRAENDSDALIRRRAKDAVDKLGKP